MKIEISQNNNLNDLPRWLLEAVKGNALLASILWQRGIDTEEKVQRFLDPARYTPTDPFAFPNMEVAVELIFSAVNAGKRICVYGDYDVDGVTSTAILVSLLRSLGADVCYHVPNRFTEGYGMNARVVTKLAKKVDLILTCDCGIANNKEVALARGLGLTVIVTDHHHLPEVLPPADAIVSPKLLPPDHPAGDIPGAGMAYFLALAILKRLERAEEARAYLDLVALAVVADVVPLKDECRYLLQQGLAALACTERLGLRELSKICGLNLLEISEEDIGFQLAPRINAAGRIKTAELAVNLLLAETEEEARTLARQLDQANITRKEISQEMHEEALTLLGEDFAGQPIILYQPHWHEGVLGITASKLSEDYHVPVLLMCAKEDSKTITGSARSIPGIHIFAELQKCVQFLTKFGGHAGAAGFSLTRDKISAFSKSMEKILADELAKIDDTKQVKVDGELALGEVDLQLYLALKKLAPFGEGNPVPLFSCREVEVIYHRSTTDEKHLRLIVKHGDTQHPAIWWWGGGAEIGRKVGLIYSIGLNRWHDKEEIQLIVNHVILKEPLESTEDLSRFKEFALEDWRNWQELGRTLPAFTDAIYYHEGLEKVEVSKAIDRYYAGIAETLVLLSCPPGLRVLKELIFTLRPEKVVLAYGDLALQSSDPGVFLKNLLTIVKNIVKQRNGHTNIYQLSLLTGEMENVVILGLRYLAEKGLLDFEFSTPDHLFLRKGDGKVKQDLIRTEDKLQILLKESRSFRTYLLKKDLPQVKTLILS